MSPLMLVGPKRAISGPNEPPRSDRVIADSWRGLYGSDPFSSIWPLATSGFLRNGAIRENISKLAVFFRARMAARRLAHYIGNRRTLAIRNLTGSGAKRILNRKAAKQIRRHIPCP